MKLFWIGLIVIFVLCLSIAVIVSCGDDPSTSSGQADDDDDDDDDTTPNDDDLYFGEYNIVAPDVWVDSSTGLMWQKTPDFSFYYGEAERHCQVLNFAGYSDWRLPTISELRSLIRGCPATETDGPCGVTDSCTSIECLNSYCDGCNLHEGPADGCYWPSELNGPCIGFFWSSTFSWDPQSPWTDPWTVHFQFGYIYYWYPNDRENVRCVRDADLKCTSTN